MTDYSVLVACCVHRNIEPRCWDSMRELDNCPSPRMVVRFKHGDALIDRSRSIVASRFYELKEYEVLLFVDDDIVFDPVDAVKIAREVKELDLDIVGGAYVKKQEVGTHFNIKTIDDQPLYFGKDGVIQEVRMVSTGFMAIHRRVVEKMVEKEIVPLCHPDDMKFWPFFQPYPKHIEGKHIYLSEDWAFCERARELGFKVWVDGTVKLGHVGPYKYNWDDSMRPPKQKYEMLKYWEENGKPFTQELIKKAS